MFYVVDSPEGSAGKVYNELVIGIKSKSSTWKLSKNLATVALLAHWRQNRVIMDEKSIRALEDSELFRRAVMSVSAAFKKSIKETNYQRRFALHLYSH